MILAVYLFILLMIPAVVLVGVAQRNSNNWYQSEVEIAQFCLWLMGIGLSLKSARKERIDGSCPDPSSICQNRSERGFHPLVCSGSSSTAESNRREGLQHSLLSSRNREKTGRGRPLWLLNRCIGPDAGYLPSPTNRFSEKGFSSCRNRTLEEARSQVGHCTDLLPT